MGFRDKIQAWALKKAISDSRTAERVVSEAVLACSSSYRQELGRSLNYDPYTGDKGDRGDYTTYAARVKALTEMWTAQDADGRGICRSVLGFRNAFIFGDGASVSSPDPKVDAFCKNYFRWNEMDGCGFYERVKVGEIDGKVVVKFYKAREGEQEIIKTAVYTYNNHQYKIEQGEPGEVTAIVIGEDRLKPEQFAYTYLGGGFADDPSDTPSVAQSIITEMKSVSRALADWRESNKLYGFSSQHMSPKDTETAEWLYDKIGVVGQDGRKSVEFNPGDTTLYPGTRTVVEQTGGASTSIEHEIAANIMLITGETGIPVYMLGWTNLMNNRATALEAADSINIKTMFERRAWEASLETELRKAIAIWNDMPKTATLKADAEIRVSIPLISMQYIQALGAVYGNLQLAGIISKRQLREVFPGFDADRAEDEIKKESGGDDVPFEVPPGDESDE